MPKIPDDMEACARHTVKRRQELELEKANNASKRERAEAMVRKYAEEFAEEHGMEVGKVTIFVCNRGSK